MAMSEFKHPDSKFLTAAFSAIIGKELVNDDSTLRTIEKVSLFDHHKTTYSYGPVGDLNNTSRPSGRLFLYIKIINGPIIDCELPSTASVMDLKQHIYESGNIPQLQQRLVLAGKQLDESRKLADYDLKDGNIIAVLSARNVTDPMILDPTTLDPMHDYDFTNITDENQTFIRGGEKYVRPCGYKRYALNVTNKYKDLIWLNCNNSPGEWPVSYHGTGEFEYKTLAQNGHPLTKGKKLGFTRGVYTTPDVRLAEKYGKQFEYNNARYLIIFQNRVNPQNLVRLSNGDENYWISQTDEDVRPYGICIRKLPN